MYSNFYKLELLIGYLLDVMSMLVTFKEFKPAGKMKLDFLENPSSTLLGYSKISNLIQACFWDFLEIAC